MKALPRPSMIRMTRCVVAMLVPARRQLSAPAAAASALRLRIFYVALDRTGGVRRSRRRGCRHAAGRSALLPRNGRRRRLEERQRRRDVGAGLRQAGRRRRSARSRSIRATRASSAPAPARANPRNDVSYGDGLYKSTDGGKTWTQRRAAPALAHLAHRRSIRRIRRHVVVGALGDVFADSADRGVYVTFDGGRSWSKTLYRPPRAARATSRWIVRNPTSSTPASGSFAAQPWTFTSGGADDGLYKSTDGGKHVEAT